MRKLLTLGLGVAIAASFATSAFAAPSRAIIQELGSVTPAGQVTVNFDYISANLAGIAAATQVGSNNLANNGTIGGTALTNVSVGVGNGFEVRTGQLPGLLSMTTIGGVSQVNQGVTVKYAGFMPGLGVYGSYGSANTTPLGAAGVAGATTSSMRIGAAYTAPVSGWILNGNVQIGSDTAAATTANVTEFALAALYPLTPNILVGGEYLNTNDVAGATTTNASGFALGGRASYGPFSLDAALYANITVSQTGSAQNGNAAVLGAPILVRASYTF